MDYIIRLEIFLENKMELIVYTYCVIPNNPSIISSDKKKYNVLSYFSFR